jgi:two-component system, sensor histidine kinase and response regulator
LENLLEWARSQTGKIRVTPECIEIKNHFDETINFIIGNAKAKGITIINMVEPSAAIWADKNMISSVTRNLLSNAIKFTKENGMVKISNEYLANGFIAIAIEDNGVGMTEDLIANLFNIKTHVSSYGTNNEKGTGLGLLICKEFIEKNNGKITVESQVGKGTKFTITLPSFKKD